MSFETVGFLSGHRREGSLPAKAGGREIHSDEIRSRKARPGRGSCADSSAGSAVDSNTGCLF